MFLNFLTTSTSQTGSVTGTLLSFLPIVALLVLMYFIMLRPQQKKEKKATGMRNSIEVGDSVTTIGGLVGRVASLKEDSFVLETGADRTKIRLKRWAIQEVEKLSLDSDASAAPAADKDAKAAK